MGVKVRELSDCECGYVISSLIELKRVYGQPGVNNEDDYNCILALIEDFKDNKVYIGEKI